MEISISCNLLDKEVEIDGKIHCVFGLEAYHVVPPRNGMGRRFVKEIGRLAKEHGKHCIVAFCLHKNLKFWIKCGWDVAGVYDRHFIITSIPVESIKVTEIW